MARTYAKVIGIILLLVGIVGYLKGEPKTLMGLNVDTFENIVHLITGALLAYGGFKGSDAQVTSWVKILSVVYFIVGVVGFFDKNLFGLVPGGLGAFDNILHLALGVVGFWAARGYKAAMA